MSLDWIGQKDPWRVFLKYETDVSNHLEKTFTQSEVWVFFQCWEDEKLSKEKNPENE